MKEIQEPIYLNGHTFAHYEVVRQIGAGGMGEVYLAKDKKLDRNVAIKILNQRFAESESDLNRFVREARAASSLNHPNILVIHEINVDETPKYIVSEYVQGETLREAIRANSLSQADILDVSIQIAGALDAAHSNGIVHRDIKPENIIVRPDRYVKILDFGLAKLVERNNVLLDPEDKTLQQNLTASGVIVGTVSYMSPEQAKGEPIDARTDIFSFGVLVYELFSGNTPFQGNSIAQTFANLINSAPIPLAHYCPALPPQLQQIVSKTLEKDKEARYQTIRDVLDDLTELRRSKVFDESPNRSPVDRNAVPTLFLNSSQVGITESIKETPTVADKKTRPIGGMTAALIAAFLVGLVGIGYYFYINRTTAANARRSVAVLPFINASQDADAEYLSDGITESVINNLSQLATLKVMSRNSAFRFKSDQTDIHSIASKLGVETVVTGDIRQAADKFIINVRLIDASDESQIWGNQYIKNAADVVAAQNEIAQAVAQNLRVKLSNSDQQRLGKNLTDNPEAYQLYLRGRFHVFKLTPPEISTGISYFQQAIQIDPNYALAYVGMADAYRSLAVGGEVSPTEFITKSLASANKAIEIDETLSESHSALGMTMFWGQWDWSGAESQYKRALELNPNNAMAHLFYAHVLSTTGRNSEALLEADKAKELDPLFPFAGSLDGLFLMQAGRIDEAIQQLQKTIELEPNFWMAHAFLGNAYSEKGNYDQAIAEAQKASQLGPSQTYSFTVESFAYSKSGRQAQGRILLDKLLKLYKERWIPPYHLAIVYAGLGEKQNALDWLERAFDQRDPKMAFLKVASCWNDIRTEPRFIGLMKRMNL